MRSRALIAGVLVLAIAAFAVAAVEHFRPAPDRVWTLPGESLRKAEIAYAAACVDLVERDAALRAKVEAVRAKVNVGDATQPDAVPTPQPVPAPTPPASGPTAYDKTQDAAIAAIAAAVKALAEADVPPPVVPPTQVPPPPPAPVDPPATVPPMVAGTLVAGTAPDTPNPAPASVEGHFRLPVGDSRLSVTLATPAGQEELRLWANGVPQQVELSLDGGPWLAARSGVVSVPPLAAGRHVVRVVAWPEAGTSTIYAPVEFVVR